MNVRAEASTDSAIVGHMNIGACGDVLAQADGWVQISSGDVKGYVKADYVTIGEEAYALAKQYYSMTAVAKEDGINLRAAPIRTLRLSVRFMRCNLYSYTRENR